MTRLIIARYDLGWTIALSAVSIFLSALVFSGLFFSNAPILEHVLDRPWLIVGYLAALAFAAIWVRPLYQIFARAGAAIWLDEQYLRTIHWRVPTSQIVDVEYVPERNMFWSSAPAVCVRLASKEERFIVPNLLDGTAPEIVANIRAALHTR